MYGFGLVSCVVDNAHNIVKAQLGGEAPGGAAGGGGWANVSMEQLLQEHERRLAARAKGKK